MSTQLKKKASVRDPFRPKFVLDDVARITLDNEHYTYKLVIYNYPRLPNNVPNHEKMGYEIVYSIEHVEDDRKFGPNSDLDQDKRVPVPVLQSTADGFEQVLMRIPKALEKANSKKRADDEENRMRRANSQRKVKNSRGSVSINDGEIDLNNPIGDNLNE